MNETLWKRHLELYPLMEPVDAVKLAYQSAFGCGHLLTEWKRISARVASEASHVEKDPLAPMYEPIGGGLCRLNLKNPAVRHLSGERIASLMRLAAGTVGKGDKSAFRRSISQLQALARQGQTPFTAQALEAYLESYYASGCPVVSHSERYRQAYNPAYRVVNQAMAQLTPLLSETDDRLTRYRHAMIVVDGPSGAGKTSLAERLGMIYHTQPISMDDFFLPSDMRTEERLATPGGNVDYERFLSQVLEPLAQKEGLVYQRYDCSTGRMQTQRRPAAEVTVIEGSYSHHPAFAQKYRSYHAIRLWVDVAEDEQLRRLMQREPEKLEMYRSQWIPLEKSYREAYHIAEKADLSVVLEDLP